MENRQRIEKSHMRRAALTLAVAKGHTDLRPLHLKPTELRQIEAFLRTLSGPVIDGRTAVRAAR